MTAGRSRTVFKGQLQPIVLCCFSGTDALVCAKALDEEATA